ncbi:3',5'-cyclic-nucleotide phosphodiesterase [Jeongeupia chitinilytica]|uniref:cAMP phosphodiesterase class-II:metallo-beta-lactamase superfamily protein n=1 Tax=Jeongeupia chitinilytica TaxID=1041641 RepID=A0ABQ3GYY4_9NEIS|nr:3',5'-cyclic-nucleotide phosphodiesterase [Jeongeupia chitinilytica]GHD61335.1 cAMP phosphodiesterase class-II:metallo-beta-lactamase superfamily protein [Jeongeupia chitinilytica]
MQLYVLGCSGGIGGAARTTSLLLGERILIDAGTGAGELSLDALCKIDHVFLTHSHFDHIACLPMLLDTVIGARSRPVTVHALPETIAALQAHVFNWQIWPDFSVIPENGNGVLRWAPLAVGESRDLDGLRITALPAQHTVPAVGYLFESPTGALAFSGDSADCPAFWETVAGVDRLRGLIVETAFSEREAGLARVSKHYSPSTLLAALQRFDATIDVWLTHLKPLDAARIVAETSNGIHRISALVGGQTLQF